jgi:acyl-homoserine-lactone acylase
MNADRALPLLTVLLLAACSQAPEGDPAPAASADRYNVDIRWTSFGIPHVKANDWGSLGYGFAYAASVDGVCVFAKELATANGTLTDDFGPTDENKASDIFHRSILTDDRLAEQRAALSPEALEYYEGFVAGYNRYLRDHADALPVSCNGEDWVRPLELDDLDRMVVAFGIRYGLGFFKEEIAAAAPPGEAVASVPFDAGPVMGLGSNAIAVGSDLTASGRGLLLGNPHYPWHGPARFHVIHTTIPGVIDVMGARLLAGHFVAIGFNKDIAWSHTVSTAMRFTLYQLELNPDNPMQYRYGEEYRDIETVSVRVPGNGATTDHTVYMTHYGPVIASQGLEWTVDSAYAIRDAIADNDRSMDTYFALQTAGSVADVEAAISKQGTFFVNTIAADRDGNAFYGDLSATPNLDAETIGQCRRSVPGLPPQIVILDGSDPACEWKNDSRSTVPGNLPAADMPRATSTEFFTNSNDSYWLSNPDRPLEGYPRVVGDERTARNLRTRAGLTFMGEALSKGSQLEPDDLQEILFSHRHFGAEVFLDDVLTLCDQPPDDIANSCKALAEWDRRADIDSRGTQLWTEFWAQAEQIPDLYAVPFDLDDPVNTPRGIALDNGDVRQAVVGALASAQEKLSASGIGLDARWGDVQFTERNGERIGIPGAVGRHGGFSYIVTDFTEGKGYTPIMHGNSYIQVIGWDEAGELDARGILTYSQSPESDSPHYADQTRLYSRGEWVDFPFTEAEILADPELETLTLRE